MLRATASDLYFVDSSWTADDYVLSLQEAGEGVNTCDFPLVFLEKAMSAKLSEEAPPVAQLMQRFFLEEKTVLEIEAMMQKDKLGIVSAVCKWMKADENQPVWQAWLPPPRFWVECELGEIVDGKSCKPCPEGSYSNEAYATECKPCQPGSALHPACVAGKKPQSFRCAVVDMRTGIGRCGWFAPNAMISCKQTARSCKPLRSIHRSGHASYGRSRGCGRNGAPRLSQCLAHAMDVLRRLLWERTGAYKMHQLRCANRLLSGLSALKSNSATAACSHAVYSSARNL